MSRRQNLAPETLTMLEFQRLLEECYGLPKTHGMKTRFSVESGYSKQTVGSWWSGRSTVPKIVILFLRDRAAISRLAEFVGQWAADQSSSSSSS